MKSSGEPQAVGAALPKSRAKHCLLALTLMALGALAGCGKSSKSNSEAVAVPVRAGEVWEIDPVAARPAMPGAFLAYVNGMDAFVLDGDNAYAGMTPLKIESGPNGARTIRLPNGLEAELTPGGDGRLNLRFSSGETAPLRKK